MSWISSGSTESIFDEPKSDPFSALQALVLRLAVLPCKGHMCLQCIECGNTSSFLKIQHAGQKTHTHGT